MANQINFKPTGPILSSSFKELSLSVETEYIDVEISLGQRILLSERYYAHNGKVTIYDLNTLFESDMRSSGSEFSDFTLMIYNKDEQEIYDTHTYNIIYCDRFTINSDVDAFLAENFLTTLSYRRVPSGTSLSVSFFAAENESLEYCVSYNAYDSESRVAYHGGYLVNGGDLADCYSIYQIKIDTAEILTHINPENNPSIVLQSVVVTCGKRSITIFIDDSLKNAQVFYFKNCFNITECVHVNGLTTCKSSVDKSEAFINGVKVFYNRSTTKTYETETAQLTSDEAEWIDQLLTSYEIYHLVCDKTSSDVPHVLVPILINEFTCEVQDGDDKLNSVKFTWQYSDKRPIVHFSASPGIFSTPFNTPFS